MPVNMTAVRLNDGYCYSAFEVPCPDPDLKSALDHVARDK